MLRQQFTVNIAISHFQHFLSPLPKAIFTAIYENVNVEKKYWQEEWFVVYWFSVTEFYFVPQYVAPVAQ